MRCIIVLALIAFTSATPLTGWGDESNYRVGTWQPYQKWSWPTYQNTHKDKVAQQVSSQALHDQFTGTHEAIQNLQEQLQQYQENWRDVNSQNIYETPWSWAQSHYEVGKTQPQGGISKIAHQVVEQNKPEVIATAIQYLNEDLIHQLQQWTGTTTESKNEVGHQLQNTIQSAIEAHRTAATVNGQQVEQDVSVPTLNELDADVFPIRVQKLIDQYNEQEIEKEISHHHHWAQQLHYQQQFVNQQKHEVEAQQVLLQQQRTSPREVQAIEQAHHSLQLHENKLIQQQLAHHLAVLHLQQVLVHQQQKIQQDTVAEHIHEQTHQENEPWSWPWQRSWSF